MNNIAHFFSRYFTEERDIPTSVSCLLLLAIICLGIFVRFQGLFDVGLTYQDNFIFFRWAYDWSVGNIYTQSTYRVACPLMGALAIKIFGPNDYALQAFHCCLGVINIVLVFSLARLLTGSNYIALFASLVQGLSRRVVEFDRFEATSTLTEFFFLLSMLFFVKAYHQHKIQDHPNTNSHVHLLISGFFLSLAAHTHWDVLAHLVTLNFFLILFALASKAKFSEYIKGGLCFNLAFVLPIALGMAFFGPKEVIREILFGKYILEVLQIHNLQKAPIFDVLILVYKRVVYGPVGSSFVGILYLVALPLIIITAVRSIRKTVNIDIHKFLLISLPFALSANYILALTILRINIEFRQALHFSPLLVISVMFALYEFSNIPAKALYLRRLSIFVVAVFVILQVDPAESFTRRFCTISPHKIIGESLRGRLDCNNRLLITPYVVPDTRYQVMTPPCYVQKEYVDHIFEYTDDAPFENLIRQHAIKFIAIEKSLADPRLAAEVGLKHVLGKAYGLSQTDYTVHKEYMFLTDYLKSHSSSLVYKSDMIEIYELKK